MRLTNTNDSDGRSAGCWKPRVNSDDPAEGVGRRPPWGEGARKWRRSGQHHVIQVRARHQPAERSISGHHRGRGARRLGERPGSRRRRRAGARPGDGAGIRTGCRGQHDGAHRRPSVASQPCCSQSEDGPGQGHEPPKRRFGPRQRCTMVRVEFSQGAHTGSGTAVIETPSARHSASATACSRVDPSDWRMRHCRTLVRRTT